MIGRSRTAKKSTSPIPIIISEVMKKGSSAGKTLLSQVSRPVKAAWNDWCGKAIIKQATMRHSITNVIDCSFMSE